MGNLHLSPENLHRVRVDGRNLLFHIPTSGLFELDEVGGAVLDLFQERGTAGAADVSSRFDGRFAPDAVADAINDLVELRVLRAKVPERRLRKELGIERYPLSTIVLNVNTGCNLHCTYCYKEDLTAPVSGVKMTAETAFRAVDLLLQQAAERERVNVVFFGGEPLTNLPLIRQVVDYAGEACARAGKTPDFSLTTNATLLDDDTIAWLDAHRFGITVSMDGPKAVHDLNRRTVGGKGTYDVVSAKVKRLLARYRSRPVGARVTLTAGITEVEAIHHHLKHEIGFFEVGFSPVTAGTPMGFALDGSELWTVFEGLKRLGADYAEQALAGRNSGFGNMHQLMTDLVEGTRKVIPCGAGVGMLAVDAEGDLHLCHRFVGSDMPTFGSVDGGIDGPALGGFLEGAADRDPDGCGRCRIRNLCAGGCYHESYVRHGDALHPVHHYCDLLRDWVDFGIETYTRILTGNPTFFEQHIDERRASS